MDGVASSLTCFSHKRVECCCRLLYKGLKLICLSDAVVAEIWCWPAVTSWPGCDVVCGVLSTGYYGAPLCAGGINNCSSVCLSVCLWCAYGCHDLLIDTGSLMQNCPNNKNAKRFSKLCGAKFRVALLSAAPHSGALTLSPPIPLRLYTFPYWSNPPFLIFDIWALWRSRLSARAPERQKLKMVG